jgi:hypothetical protein
MCHLGEKGQSPTNLATESDRLRPLRNSPVSIQPEQCICSAFHPSDNFDTLTRSMCKLTRYADYIFWLTPRKRGYGFVYAKIWAEHGGTRTAIVHPTPANLDHVGIRITGNLQWACFQLGRRNLDRGGHSCMSDSLPTITLSIIHWQSKTLASEPELRPASELHTRLEHGQDDVPGWWSGSGAGNCAFVSLLWEYDAAPPGTK